MSLSYRNHPIDLQSFYYDRDLRHEIVTHKNTLLFIIECFRKATTINA